MCEFCDNKHPAFSNTKELDAFIQCAFRYGQDIAQRNLNPDQALNELVPFLRGFKVSVPEATIGTEFFKAGLFRMVGHLTEEDIKRILADVLDSDKGSE